MKNTLYIIIPCYNEQEVLPITSKLFLEELLKLIEKNKISDDSRILFVNDGSKDNTWQIIKDLSKNNPHFLGISQSRNRGHQNAVLAGLMEAKDKADITITIDCDGQDDITAMEKMILQLWRRWWMLIMTAVKLYMVSEVQEKQILSLNDLQRSHSINF